MKTEENAAMYQKTTAVKVSDIANALSRTCVNGDRVIFDFGEHTVGHVTLEIKSNTVNDSPLSLLVRFAEIPAELNYNYADYKGWVSSTWLTDETVTLDVLPCEYTLPSRFAFRYMSVLVTGHHTSFGCIFDDVYCDTQTSADRTRVKPLSAEVDGELRRIDEISLKTLEDCMQYVFEDGPKRDRRLWIGDMRLQALANYATFDNRQLVKYCLYNFAAMPISTGQTSPCFYTEPYPHPDKWAFIDYSLFFISCLYDYYRHTGEREVLCDLYDEALRQADFVTANVIGDNGIVKNGGLYRLVSGT